MSIEIKSNGFDAKIIVKFGDIFTQDGWEAVAVNDFFDSIVDDRHVSSTSLHGFLLQNYWSGNIADWDKQVDSDLSQLTYETTERTSGKSKRYEVGTVARVVKDGQRFLAVALTKTETATLEVRATSADLHKAVRGLLRKARSCCANEPLNIPLLGSGLSRVGIKNNILVDLILTAIFEETKLNKVTDEVRIILPMAKASQINLSSLQRDWS